MRRKKISIILLGMLLFSTVITGCTNRNNMVKPADEHQAASNQKEVLKSFEAITLDNNTFTQEDLAQKDVTVINFWSVMCGPCIEEMPELAKFRNNLPENVELLTVCLDGNTDTESVKQILQEAEYEGITLLGGTGDFQKLSDEIQYTPTTIIVDKDGNMIGEEMIGGQEDLSKTLTEAVNAALRTQGKAEISNENIRE